MSIFKTTLSVESTDQSTPIKLTTSYNHNLLDNIVMGKVTVSTNPTPISLGAGKSRGSYLYVKSSEKNPKQNIIGIITAGGVITLSPGEFAAIPLYTFDDNNGPGGPFGNDNLGAFTTHGTAELEYFTGSRGEDVGENVLVRYKDPNTTTWKFFTLDANTAIPGNGPAIWMNNGTIDTQINYGDWPNSQIEGLVNRKGYIIRFWDNSGNNKFVFVNSRGSIIDTENINQNYSRYFGDGRANLITWYDGDDGHAIYFDGDNYWTHDFPNINNIYVDTNYDDCTADGTFPVFIEGYNGTGNEATFLIKGEDNTLIKNTNPNNNWTNSYAYSHGNFIVVETLTEGNTYNEVETLEIFNTDGTLLKTVNINKEIQNRDLYFYGSGKMQIVYKDADSGDYIFLNYNQLTGKLIGEDLTWTSSYGAYEVVCDNYRTDAYYALSYKPESVAIIKYDDYDQYNQKLLSQETDGALEVTYIINNDLEQRNYVVPNTENSFFVSVISYGSNYATEKDFILLSGDNQISGPLVATRFTSGAEPTRFNLINNLGTYNVSSAAAYVRCFGDYRVLRINTTGNAKRELIVFDSKVLDKVSMHINQNDWEWEFNTLIAVDYNVNKEWYFNTSTKKWTLLPTYADGDYWTTNGEGDQYPVNPGKILFVRDQYTPTQEAVYGRMITRGAAANEKELLKLGNIYTWNLSMSTETIVLAYREISNSNWKVRVFDLNLNLLYEVDTEKPNLYTWDYYGKVNYWIFYDNNNNNTHYKFGKLMSSLSVYQPDGHGNYAFNNMAWW
jgi:hypothetical protein